MRTIFLIIILIFISYAKSDNILIKKEKNININDVFINNIILIKNAFIEKTNNLLPTPLQIDKKESTFKSSITFDSLKNQPKLKINANLKLPFFEIKQNIKQKENNQTKNYYISFTIRPIVKLTKSLIPYLKISLSQSDNKIFFNNYIFKYFFSNKKWDFLDEYILKKDSFSFKIFLHFNKDELKDVDYGEGIYFVLKKTKKKLLLNGYETNGITNKKPFFSTHKLFLTFKSKVFKSNRTTFEFTPYILYKKDKKFKFNIAFFSAITYQF